MSGAIRIPPPPLRLFQQTKPQPNNILSPSHHHHLVIKTASSYLKTSVDYGWVVIRALKSRNSEDVDSPPPPPPLSLELNRVSSEPEFDLILDEANNNHQPVVVLWMASWCRKCIYLKPKLEKLAAQYNQRVRFYCVDVNGVSHKFVVRAEVTKMPTIQLWKDGKKQAEVIGGHKAFLVVNDVRNMIESENSS